jgi:NAD(P)-dependent dehydrogenase (short-subunit alcohol dehydrogenase family)
MGKLEGKIALITGRNSGIGLATAKQFVNEGAYVFITGRPDTELAAAVIGKNATGVQGDVSKSLINYPWSSYRCYVERTKKPEWLTTAAVLEFLGEGTARKFAAQYRRELEEAAALGEWETDWKDKVKAF